MFEGGKLIWKNGEYLNWEDATTHVLTHTLHYGVGVFEGIRCYETDEGPAVFRLKEHVKRLFESAKIFMMKIPFSEEEIFDAILDTVKKNELKSCYIRPIVYYGYKSLGLSVNDEFPVDIVIAAWSWGAYLGEEGIKNGIRVKTSSFNRFHVNTIATRAKACGNYITSVLAKREALMSGYDEALFLDPDGYVAEGSGENVFIIKDGVVYTPPVTSILKGITRDSIITIARDLGYEVIERRFTRDEMYIADEAFFTGTAAEVTPIRELDGRPIGIGKRGEITEKIQSTFFDIVKGKNKKYSDWLAFVK
ncbi:branched-chain amino acid transaminase [Deferribacter autotrophicus]|uniref:Branched-chain-amino-acid aminotransferase n=1 Tax=Deferribacter autotrophicus TaxID=500465 RepID=A0A5A8F2M1_9BACT|nr:branched-chain amino acid transaminase [Deferribacter autotrophicus]KAA0257714.1 branched-chain amino acid transaminase [Deferribacter autotrophicus]